MRETAPRLMSYLIGAAVASAALPLSARASDAIRQYSATGEHGQFRYGVFNPRWLGAGGGAGADAAGGVLIAITGLSPDARGDVIIPDSLGGRTVYGIDGNAFSDCEGIVSLTIPKSVKFLKPGTLNRCRGLQRVVVDEDHPDYSTVDGVLFSKDKSTLLFCGSGREGLYTVPRGVTAIGASAFAHCSWLKGVTIPLGVTDVGGRQGSVFLGCVSLESIDIPDTVTNVGQKSFQDCKGLVAAELPEGIVEVPFGLFWNCSELVHISLPDGVTSIGNYAFAGCRKMKLPRLPEGLAKVGAYAFKDCESLEGLARPQGLTTIGRGAFQGSPIDFSAEPGRGD